MGRPSGVAWAILLFAGIVLVLGGAAAIVIGLVDPTLISSQLPPEAEVDASAVGGAAVALGMATAFLGVVHIGTALALRHGIRHAATAAVALASTMAILSFAFAVAALVSIASGAAPPIYMLPAAVGLGAAVIAYALVSGVVIGACGGPI